MQKDRTNYDLPSNWSENFSLQSYLYVYVFYIIFVRDMPLQWSITFIWISNTVAAA